MPAPSYGMKEEHRAVSLVKKILDLDQYSLKDDHILMRYFELCFRDISGLQIDNDRNVHCVYDFEAFLAGVLLGDGQS